MIKNTLLVMPFVLMPCLTFSDEFTDDLEDRKDHRGWFVGGRIGQESTNFEVKEYSIESSKNTNLAAIYFGYNFTDWFGLEADFGYTGSPDTGLFSEKVIDNAGFGGLKIQPKFTWQMTDDFGLFAKAGLYSAAYVIQASDEFRYYSYQMQSWSGLGYSVGVGAQFSVTEGLNLRIAYDYSTVELEASTDNDLAYAIDIDAVVSELSVGIHYQF